MIHLIEGSEVVLSALQALMEGAGHACAKYAAAAAFAEHVGPATWGVVLLSHRHGDVSAVDALRLFAERGFDFPVVVHGGDVDVPEAVRLLKAGAFDLLANPMSEEALFRSLASALAAEMERRGPRAARKAAAARFGVLSPRELEVLQRLLQGDRNKAVAATLGIAAKTVEHHRAAIFRKLGVPSLAAAALLYDAARKAAE